MVASGVGATAELALLRHEAYDSRQRKGRKNSREDPGGLANRVSSQNSPPRKCRPEVGAREVRVPAGDAERVLEVGHPEERVAKQRREAARVSARGREAHLPR